LPQALTLGRAEGLTTQESIKVAALATANLYAAERPEAIQQAVQALSINPTSAALETFTHQLAIEHQPLFLESLSLSVQKASLKIGFINIQTSIADNGALEIFAKDDRGRNLVTVIGSAIDSETTIATEVSGISDSTCSQILDDFAKALAEVGVNASPPERKSTGGICTLAATKKFVSSQPTKSKTTPTTKSKPSTRRQVTQRQSNQQF
jgi:hypothetical protein